MLSFLKKTLTDPNFSLLGKLIFSTISSGVVMEGVDKLFL